MPFKRPGGLIDLGTLGDRQVPSIPATRLAMPPIQINRWVRNGLPPNAEYEDLKNEALNQAAMWRTKTCFQFPGWVFGPRPLSDASDKWRTAFRTSSMAHAMIVSAVMAPPLSFDVDKGGHAQLKIFSDADESTEVSSTDFYYGPNPGGDSGWPIIHEVTKMVDVEPDTDYYVLIREMEGVNLFSMCALELASMAVNNNGYLAQNIGAHDPVLDVYRQKQVTFLKEVWESYDSPVFQWSANPGGTGVQFGYGTAPNFDWKTTSDTTPSNILDYDLLGGVPDTNSTTVSANTPGWKPDMRMKARKSQTNGVPCVMKAFGKWEDTGATQPGGTVKLLDSTGATVVEIADGWTHGADPTWVSASFDLPADYLKYDVHFASNSSGLAGTFYLWAVSIYPVG